MKKNSPAFFASADGEWFTGNDAARGPWSADACHAGPVTGLSQATLFDERGPIGVASQTLLIQPAP